ncbi:hypothetical protein [Burkholderia pyrrocinia]|uniref:hypothetical protein n=1 Tax=Burkholderia pyrrocinia TaxID=60550 RepID=UPI0015899138|nr:hypothetical protein [Burkholderia pyrrocinia]
MSTLTAPRRSYAVAILTVAEHVGAFPFIEPNLRQRPRIAPSVAAVLPFAFGAATLAGSALARLAIDRHFDRVVAALLAVMCTALIVAQRRGNTSRRAGPAACSRAAPSCAARDAEQAAHKKTPGIGPAFVDAQAAAIRDRTRPVSESPASPRARAGRPSPPASCRRS